MHEFFQKMKKVRKQQILISLGISLILLFSLSLLREKKKAILLYSKKVENHSSSKQGFSLFDSYVNKGERELQILELRALKGQIEQDLELFSRIKEAHVLLDFHPGRFFGQQKMSKASVILSLEEHVLLTESELLAICYHLCAAIQDLDIKQIAISDTQGRLYKKQDSAVCISYASSSVKEVLANRVQIMLEKVMGKEHFSFCIQECPLSIHFLFDERFRSKHKQIIPHLLKQIEAIDPEISPCFEWAYFGRKSRDLSKIYWAGAIFFLISFGGIYGIKRVKEQKQGKNNDGRLAELIKDQPPKTLAIMLSYLDPTKAKKVLEALPVATQDAIANHYRIREG